MKKIKGYVVLTEKELATIKKQERKDAVKASVKNTEQLEATIKKRDKTISNLEDAVDTSQELVERLETKIAVLEDDRDDVRAVFTKEMANEDTRAILEQQKAQQDKAEARLKDRETKLGSAEDASFKKGYADGISDGLRKISKITQSDRDAAMKIAMVSAASHTSPNVMQEIEKSYAITAGNTDDKADEPS